MYSLASNWGTPGTPYRDAIINTLIDLMKDDERLVCLEADLGGASGTKKIGKVYPARYFEVGIAEANMMGMAAGLSSEGFVPFVHSFGPFATRRCFDQIYMSGAYAKNTINIWASDPGFTVGPNGGTHTTWEDVALMRTIPHSVVCDPADPVQMAWIVRAYAQLNEGIHFIRSGRKSSYTIYTEDSTFELGHGNVLTQGSDVLIITAGQLVKDALEAAAELNKQGISTEVIDMFCIKPLDADLVVREAAGKKAVVTFENHNVVGGLGDAVAATLLEAGAGAGTAMPKFLRHGVRERFGQVGTADFLQAEYHLCASDLVASVTSLLA